MLLILIGPAITVTVLVPDSPLQALGWLPVHGIPWVTHLIAPWPMLAATRPWARIAVPLSVSPFSSSS